MARYRPPNELFRYNAACWAFVIQCVNVCNVYDGEVVVVHAVTQKQKRIVMEEAMGGRPLSCSNRVDISELGSIALFSLGELNISSSQVLFLPCIIRYSFFGLYIISLVLEIIVLAIAPLA